MCWRSKPANRVLRSGNDIPTSLTLTQLRWPIRSRLRMAIIATCVLVNIEREAKMLIRKDKIANYLKMSKLQMFLTCKT